jgi:putative transcriptional regulator
LTIIHHLDDATILAYAAGTLGEPLSIAVAAHIAMCPTCRVAARRAETLGGEILESLELSGVSDVCRAATLASLDINPEPPRAPSLSPVQSLIVAKDYSALRWRKVAPGVSVVKLPLSKGAKGSLKLLSIAPGMTMLEHGHGGGELTLVLQGAFKDKIGRFGVGDIADLDETVEHCPIVEEGETCICLFATEAPARYTTLIGRLLQPFIGI